MTENPNVTKLREAQRCLEREPADVDGYLALFSPDVKFYGWDLEGNWVLEDLEKLRRNIVALPQLFDEVRTELIDAEAVGADIVAAKVRLMRRRENHVVDAVVLCFYRFEQGMVTLAGSLVPKDIEDFYKRLIQAGII